MGSHDLSQFGMSNLSRRNLDVFVCRNNPKFVDFLGLNCDHHYLHTKSCKDTWIVGYPTAAIESLLLNCPKACKLCGLTDDLKDDVMESIYKKDSQSNRVECADDPEYRDRLGMNCRQYSAIFDCGMFASVVGFNSVDIKQLLHKCPRSCGVCTNPPTASPSVVPSFLPSYHPSMHPSKSTIKKKKSSRTKISLCRDNINFKDWNGLQCSDFKELNCLLLETIGYQDVEKILEECPKSCQICDGDKPQLNEKHDCKDNELFEDSKGLKCKHHKFITQCNTIDFWGYSQKEISSIRKNCLFTCGACNIETHTPSKYPSIEVLQVPSLFPSHRSKISVASDVEETHFRVETVDPFQGTLDRSQGVIMKKFDLTGATVVLVVAIIFITCFLLKSLRNNVSVNRYDISDSQFYDMSPSLEEQDDQTNHIDVPYPCDMSIGSEITEVTSNRASNKGPLVNRLAQNSNMSIGSETTTRASNKVNRLSRNSNIINESIQEENEELDGSNEDFLSRLHSWKHTLESESRTKTSDIKPNFTRSESLKGILKRPSILNNLSENDNRLTAS